MAIVLISALIFASASAARVGVDTGNIWAGGSALFTMFCAGFIYGRHTKERAS